MMYDGIKLTNEQTYAIECMVDKEDTTIQAPAGSGKTFLLKAGSSELKKFFGDKGTYIAFNKAIADEARATFPNNVECRTAHSLAFGKEGYKFKNRLKGLTGGKLANMVDIGEFNKYPTRATKGYLILDTLRKFCYSNDRSIGTQHMPYIPDQVKDKETIKFWYNDIPIQAVKVWNKMIDENDSIPVTHDMYLKLWALHNPVINKDFILFDEAQDANPVMLGIVNNQKYAQKIFVGDRYQQIYEWRGATNAMDLMQQNTANAFLSQSFRFGQAIADVANKVLQNYTPDDEHPIIIKGNKERDSKVEEIKGCPDAVICRTNAGVIKNVFQYLNKYKVYIQGGSNQLISLLLGAKNLQDGKKTLVPELALFSNWEEVLEFTETSDGKQLKGVINLIKKYGINELISLLKQTEQNSSVADVTITTCHKAKGLEWGTVKLGDDFKYPEDEKQLPSGEINVLYVAATRALNVLDISNCMAANVDYVLRTFK